MKYSSLIPPQHGINVQDCALLHVAALLHPRVAEERIFGMAVTNNWTLTTEIFRGIYPNTSFMDSPPGVGKDMITVEGEPKESLPTYLGRDRWTPYETSIMQVVDTLQY